MNFCPHPPDKVKGAVKGTLEWTGIVGLDRESLELRSCFFEIIAYNPWGHQRLPTLLIYGICDFSRSVPNI